MSVIAASLAEYLRPLGVGLLALVLAGCSEPPPEAPAPWVVVFHNSRITAMVDTSRVIQVGDARNVLLRFDYPDAEQIPGEAGTFSRLEVLQQVNCAEETTREIHMSIYTAEGEQVGESALEKPAVEFRRHPFRDVLPPLCEQLAKTRSRPAA